MKQRRLCLLAVCLCVVGMTLSLSFSWTKVETDYGKFVILSPHFTQVNATNEAVICCAYCDDPQIGLCLDTTDDKECVITTENPGSCSTRPADYSCD